MCKFSPDSKAKIGNTIIYIANHTGKLSKTKLLKLLYIMESTMVRKYHVPFLAIPYEVWKWGPVQKDLFADLSDNLFLMKDYISAYFSEDRKYFRAKAEFNDDEFSQLEIGVMDEVLEEYGKKTVQQLESILHQPSSLWYRAAEKNNVLSAFSDGTCNNTDIKIDFSDLLSSPEDKEEYIENLAIQRTANNYNAHANV